MMPLTRESADDADEIEGREKIREFLVLEDELTAANVKLKRKEKVTWGVEPREHARNGSTSYHFSQGSLSLPDI